MVKIRQRSRMELLDEIVKLRQGIIDLEMEVMKLKYERINPVLTMPKVCPYIPSVPYENGDPLPLDTGTVYPSCNIG